MALNTTRLSDSFTRSNTAGTSYQNDATLTPTADVLAVLLTGTYDTGGAAEQPTIGGTNVWNTTWTHIGGLSFDSGDWRIDAYTLSVGASPTGGFVSLTCSATHEGFGFHLYEVNPDAGETPGYATGTFGSDNGATGTSFSIDTGTPTGVTFGFGMVEEQFGNSFSGDTGFTDSPLWSGGIASSWNGRAFHSDSGTDPVSATWSSSRVWGGIAFEIHDTAGAASSAIAGGQAGQGGLAGAGGQAGAHGGLAARMRMKKGRGGLYVPERLAAPDGGRRLIVPVGANI